MVSLRIDARGERPCDTLEGNKRGGLLNPIARAGSAIQVPSCCPRVVHFLPLQLRTYPPYAPHHAACVLPISFRFNFGQHHLHPIIPPACRFRFSFFFSQRVEVRYTVRAPQNLHKFMLLFPLAQLPGDTIPREVEGGGSCERSCRPHGEAPPPPPGRRDRCVRASVVAGGQA